MEKIQREGMYSYLYKIVLSLISLFLIYNVISILIISPHKGKLLQSRVFSAINTIKSNMGRVVPKELEEIVCEPYLLRNLNGSPWSNRIERPSIFAGPVKDVDVEKESEEQAKAIQHKKVPVLSDTEIVFKGLADDLVLINVRRKIDGQWYEQCFPTKMGERIGKEKLMGSKTIDFKTNCILQDIVRKVQKPVTLKKKTVTLSEDGGFVGYRIVTGETFMKSSSKIIYKDEDGNLKELWLGESGII